MGELSFGQGLRGDLSRGAPRVKGFAFDETSAPLNREFGAPTTFTKALGTRAFRTAGDADFGSPKGRTFKDLA
jgi:hypothetical protein